MTNVTVREIGTEFIKNINNYNEYYLLININKIIALITYELDKETVDYDKVTFYYNKFKEICDKIMNSPMYNLLDTYSKDPFKYYNDFLSFIANYTNITINDIIDEIYLTYILDCRDEVDELGELMNEKGAVDMEECCNKLYKLARLFEDTIDVFRPLIVTAHENYHYY